jgi:hypothetical protein
MTKSTKTYGTAFLLLLIAAPMLLSLVMLFQRSQLRQQMEEALEKECLQTIVIAKTAVVWENNGSELLIDGQRLFDVQETEDLGDKIVFTGLFDEQETTIKEKLSKLGNNGNQQILLGFFIPLFVSQLHSPVPQPIYVITKSGCQPYRSNHYQHLLSAPLVPPPDADLI